MTDQNTPNNPDDCGCCAGLAVATPTLVTNRPGLSALVYRVGTYAQFKQSMLARLSSSDNPGLHALRTRDADDFSIALLDAWSSVADVMTFYQERIADEQYLRTATERFSILEMARLIGYELRPGLAASTYLAFTLESGPGSPGFATIDIGTKVQSIPGQHEQPQTFETIEKIDARAEWNLLKPVTGGQQTLVTGQSEFRLKGTTTNLKPGDGMVFVTLEREKNSKSDKWDFRRVRAVQPNITENYTSITLDGPLDKAGVPDVKIYVLRRRAAPFGYNAPDPRVLSDEVVDRLNHSRSLPDWLFGNVSPKPISPTSIYLDSSYPAIQSHGFAVIVGRDLAHLCNVTGVTETGLEAFTLTGKSTQLNFDGVDLLGTLNLYLREVTVYAQSELLELAKVPLPFPIATLTLTLEKEVDGLIKGQTLIVAGNDSKTGQLIAEAVTLAKTPELINGQTKLTFAKGLQQQYQFDSIRIYGNVAAATHGESKQEVLGSGDATQVYQKFTLRQPPLTYLSASNPSGSESSLTVRVNNLQWHERSTLYGAGPRDRTFITRTGDDGKTTIQFGDGRTGARLPTGRDNITATYRKGIGVAGSVKAGQLTQLLTRPLGVKSVVNPTAAIGGTDHESLGEARRNAPLTVLTLDRVVSLLDYEDFARAFSGVAKALATWTWTGQTRGVFLTIAGPDGAPIPEDSKPYINLVTSIQSSGDPHIPLRVKTFLPANFKISASIKVNSDFQIDLVLAAVEKTLRSAFSFDARAFGQAVALSEVVSVIQTVAGVEATLVDKLYRTDENPTLHNRLRAAAPQPGDESVIAAAELLTLSADPIDLKVML